VAKRKGNKGEKVTVDFTGVTGKSGGSKVPEGDYVAQVNKVTQEYGQQSNKPYLQWELQIVEGKQKGKKLWHKTSLQPQALFNLRNTLEALEMEVPQSALELDLGDLVNSLLGVSVEIEIYQGKEQSRVIDVFPAADISEELSDEDEEEEEEEEAEEEEEEEEDEEDYEDMSLRELKKLCKSRKLEVPAKATKEDLIDVLEEADEEE